MKRSNLPQCVAAFTLAIAMSPNSASAQDVDTLTISGSFSTGEYGELVGTVGDDLAAVSAAGNDNTWTLSLHGVTYSYDWNYEEWPEEWGDGYDEEFITRVHATAFDLEFFGPDADLLNAVVSQQLVSGGLTDGAVLEFVNGDSIWPYSDWALDLEPTGSGVAFNAGYDELFGSFWVDENGYPVVPQQVLGNVWIEDFRPGNDGYLASYVDTVDISSSTPTPPPSPAPPTLSIADASVQEGDRGTTWLDLTVTLSSYPDDLVAVDYATFDGTARDRKDYYGTGGTLLFGPDEISHTISIEIKGDRRREADEIFYVELSSPAFATIADGEATATILNDD